jgi:hypothetical protein
VTHFTTRRVTAIISERPGLQRVDVEGHPAYVLTHLIGPVAVGDEVVVNTTAVDLDLGSGGSDIVHWNLSRHEWNGRAAGHVLKLRYTSLQSDTGVAEESSDYQAPAGLGGTPVVACALHSQVGAVAMAFHRSAPAAHLVYVMTDSAALPLALSDLVSNLRDTGALAATVTSGQSFGGDLEAVNVYSALLVAASAGAADAIVVGPGPGVVGTETELGFTGLEVVTAVDAAARLGAEPILAVRYSDADMRERHRGVSHHTTTALELMDRRPVVPVPSERESPAQLGETVAVDVPEIDYGDLTTMGRTCEDDPGFFLYAAAAGTYAAGCID